jgi:serine/threonine protein kinase
MGVVYKAQDLHLNRLVALKFLSQGASKDPSALERFRREALAASALDHPNICTIYDIEDHDEQPFIVMQFLEGVTLRDRIDRGPIKIKEILEFGVQIADALDRAHRTGIVHRDIKPGNIFITAQGTAKLLDFGLARFRPADPGMNVDAASAPTIQANLSSTGAILGTISYMSPEQALHGDVDARSDLFSLGVVLYEMATGKLPFTGITAAATFDCILHRSPPDPAALRPELPRELISVIRKALAKTPDERHQTAAVLRAELLRVGNSLSAKKPPHAGNPLPAHQSTTHPDHIGKYLVEEYLGGGMSHVYRAKDPVLGKTVAIKILTADSARDQESRSRFLREARMAANIEHPNIITVYDFGEDGGRPYMVMEFLKGEDLRTFIRTNRAVSLAERLRIGVQIAKALQYIHERQIVHRDVKPENIHLGPAGVVKMMDFGIAKTEDLTLTRPGFTMGTPYYMAPEQILGKEVTPSVDVYAYGILLFELFTGSRPVTGETVEQIFFRVLQEPLDLEPLSNAGVPESIIALIRSCTAKDPSQRPPDFSGICAALVKEIETFEAPPAPVSTPVTPLPSSTRRWMLAGVVAVLVLSAVLGLFLYWTSEPQPRVDSGKPSQPAPPPAVLQTVSGEMVLVPEGEFLSGADKKLEKLRAFYIDRTEVSNETYGRFCKETNRPPPLGLGAAPPDFPVVNITIDDARQFARWAGKRLPTLNEWQKAARGGDGREYPWGDEANATLANVGGASAASVTAFPQGDSPWGVRQMIGNVWEFVDELSTPSPQAIQSFRDLLKPPPTKDEPWYRIMGGSYEEPLLPRATHDSAYIPARFRSTSIGFRCVKDLG